MSHSSPTLFLPQMEVASTALIASLSTDKKPSSRASINENSIPLKYHLLKCTQLQKKTS
jgi:hypothetical protein